MNNRNTRKKGPPMSRKTNKIKAIETRYKGYRFRSRLEARWAVFFDTLGLSWEYEPEGFELPGVGRYLPDFKLLDTGSIPDIWVEVKPNASIPKKEVVRLFRIVGALMSRERNVGFFLLRGDPLTRDGIMHGSFAGEQSPPLMVDPLVCIGRFYNLSAEIVDSAAAAARSARFEFGESP